MADIPKIGIGLDTRQGEQSAKRFAKSLTDVDNAVKGVGTTSKTTTKSVDGLGKAEKETTTSTMSMTKAMIASQLAIEGVKVVTTALVGAFKEAVTIGKDFESNMSRVAAISKATSTEMVALTEAAQKMGETTQFTASQASNALEAMARAGFNAQKAIGALPEVLNLSAASGVSLGQSADTITNIMAAFSAKTEDLVHINNVLVETFTSSNTTLESLASSISFAGGIANATGVSIEQLSAAIGVLGDAGVSGSRAGTALRASMSRLLDPSKEAIAVFKELNIEAGQNLIQTLEALEEAGASTSQIIKIFGQEAGGAIITMQQAGGIQKVQEFAQRLNDVGDVASETAQTMQDNLNGALNQLSSAIEGVEIEAFNANAATMTEIVNEVTVFVRENKDSFIELADAMGNTIKIAFELGQELGPALGSAIILTSKAINGMNILFAGAEKTLRFFSHHATQLVGVFEMLRSAISGDRQGVNTAISALMDLENEYQKEQEETTQRALKQYDAMVGIETQLVKLGNRTREATTQTQENTKAQKENNETKEEAVNQSIPAKIAAVEQEIAKEQILNEEIRQKTMLQEIEAQATDAVTDSIIRQNQSLDVVTEGYRQATQEAKLFTDATSRALGTGSILGGMGGLVGSTFSVPTGGGTGARAGLTPQNVTRIAQQTGTAQTDLSRQLASFQRLSQQIADFMAEDKAAELRLVDAQAQLRRVSEDLALLGEDELSRRFDLSQEYFDLVKEIESLNNTISNDQIRAAKTVENTLSGVLKSYETLKLSDLGSLLPIDKFELLEQKFMATAQALDGIDFANITDVDQGLIADFTTTAEQYLSSAQEVFKSSDPYQQIRQTVEGEFGQLAANLNTTLNTIDSSNVTRQAVNANFAFNGVTSSNVKTQTDAVNTSLLGLSGQIQNLDNTTQSTEDETDSLNATLKGSTSNFSTMTSNLQSMLNNMNTTIASVTTKFAEMGTAIAAGETVTDAGTTPTLEQPTQVAREFVDFTIGQDYAGRYTLVAVSNTGERKTIGVTTFRENIADFGTTASVFDEQLQRERNFELIGGQVYRDGSLMSLATGAWQIGRNQQRAVLHQGEMVVRNQDTPAVQEFLRNTGRSDAYGMSSNGGGGMLGTEQLLIALDGIKQLLENMPAPKVFLDSRLVSDELTRFNRLAGQV